MKRYPTLVFLATLAGSQDGKAKVIFEIDSDAVPDPVKRQPTSGHAARYLEMQLPARLRKMRPIVDIQAEYRVEARVRVTSDSVAAVDELNNRTFRELTAFDGETSIYFHQDVETGKIFDAYTYARYVGDSPKGANAGYSFKASLFEAEPRQNPLFIHARARSLPYLWGRWRKFVSEEDYK